MPTQEVIHIVKSREKPAAQTKTCQRVCLPQRFFADPKKNYFSGTLVLRLNINKSIII
jgi:hypothetical protein